MTAQQPQEGFAGRVLVLLATQLISTSLGIVSALVQAHLLGPSGKGQYYLAVLIPATIIVVLQVGIPQALNYFTARGQTRDIVRRALLMMAILSAAGLGGVLIALPALRETLLREIGEEPVILGLLAIPFLLNATFMTGIVIGRQAVRWNLTANLATGIVSLGLIIVLVGFLHMGVVGAVVAYLVSVMVQSGIFLVGATRVARAVTEPAPMSYRECLTYGLRLYPGSLTQFLGYRIDVYLLAALAVDSATQLGYYSMAVTAAEMAFFIPSAVSSLFFPRIAGADRASADQQVPATSRLTLIISVVPALALVPAAAVLFFVVLPRFGPAFPALLILLPGIVGASVSKVLSSYVQGIGRPGASSAINGAALAVNVVANVLLIPSHGIIGAAAASLISYGLASAILTVFAARLAGAPLLAFWLPRGEDLRAVLTAGAGVVARLRRRPAGTTQDTVR